MSRLVIGCLMLFESKRGLLVGVFTRLLATLVEAMVVWWVFFRSD